MNHLLTDASEQSMLGVQQVLEVCFMLYVKEKQCVCVCVCVCSRACVCVRAGQVLSFYNVLV